MEILSTFMHGGHTCTEYIATVTIQISSSSFKAGNIGDVEIEIIELHGWLHLLGLLHFILVLEK